MSGFGYGTFGSSAFGSSGYDPNVSLSDAFAGATVAHIAGTTERLSQAFATLAAARVDNIHVSLAQAMELGSTLLSFDLPNLAESLAATGSILGVKETFPDASDTVDFPDTVNAAWLLLLSDSALMDGVIEGDRALIGAVVDTLVATGTAASYLDAMAALTAALAMEDAISQGWSATAVDSADFQDVFATALAAYGALVSDAVMGDTALSAVRLVAVLSEDMAAADSSLAVATLLADGTDGVLIYGTFRLGADEFAGWVLNTVNKAPSQYTQFPFESLAFFAGKSLGAGAGGIYEHTGDDDDGDPIAAFIKTGLMDMGSTKLKNVPDVWVGFKGDGRLVLKVITTNITGEKVEDWYISDPDTRGGELREGRFQLGRGIDSRYWQWVVHNKAGEDFELADLKLRPVILSRRR